jgi:hypothetical protein
MSRKIASEIPDEVKDFSERVAGRGFRQLVNADFRFSQEVLELFVDFWQSGKRYALEANS